MKLCNLPEGFILLITQLADDVDKACLFNNSMNIQQLLRAIKTVSPVGGMIIVIIP